MEAGGKFKLQDKIVLKNEVSFWSFKHIVLPIGTVGVVTKVIRVDDLYEITFQNPPSKCQIGVEKLENLDSKEGQELQAKNPVLLTRQGYEFFKANKIQEAIEKYNQTLKIDPNFSLARSNLAHAYKNQGKLEEAIREWEETLKRGAPDSIAIPIPRCIAEAKRLLCGQENKNKDKDLKDVDKILSSYIEELEKEDANWRDIYTKVVRIRDTATPMLIKALGSTNETLQVRVVDLLIKIGGKNAIDALKEAYGKGNEKLRFHIKYYIKDIDE